MHINRLRLLGFKSFVEPTELVIEKGLTGVVGPNGCGKSNLLEALRWVMGETSHKSMRAAAMDDVIFSGTQTRPARNSAEVTIFIDNSDRKAPAEFNASDTLEVTRRIEREAGSAYRVNSREVRARDVRILFEDAATGARSPALVRQGQISEIVNAKPEQRRRILEDAAGIAGLHSRRHEAELRLRAAESNLARVNDILGQLNSQIEGLKRQARQARRYKELSSEIRRGDAILAHLRWVDAQQHVDAEEAALAAGLEKVGRATEAEAQAVVAEAEAADKIQPLREQEAAKGAVLHRFKVEQENLEREAQRAAARQRELEGRIAQLGRDLAREESLIAEAKETLARLDTETESLANTTRLAADFEQKALADYDAADSALKVAEVRLADLTTRTAETRARRQSLESQRAERQGQVTKLERQMVALDAQTREIVGRAPDASKLKAAAEIGQTLMAEIAEIEARTVTAEDMVLAAVCRSQSQGRDRGATWIGCRPAQDRGRDAGQAADSGRRQRPAAGSRSDQGSGRVRDGPGGGARRGSRRAGRRGSACALAHQRRQRQRPGAAQGRRATHFARGGTARADASPAPGRHRLPGRRPAPAEAADSGPASGLPRGRSMALGRVRCRGSKRHGRRQPARRA